MFVYTCLSHLCQALWNINNTHVQEKQVEEWMSEIKPLVSAEIETDFFLFQIFNKILKQTHRASGC